MHKKCLIRFTKRIFSTMSDKKFKTEKCRLKEYNITKRLRNMKRNKYLKCINLELFQFQKVILKNFKF
jgi:hypothetical protein